jgi:K+-sensing histidine kinase KdpD
VVLMPPCALDGTIAAAPLRTDVFNADLHNFFRRSPFDGSYPPNTGPRMRLIHRAPLTPARYGVAVGSCLVALVAAWLATPIDAEYSIAPLLFLAAVGVAAWYGGLGPALAATALGALAIDYFFELPGQQIQITSTRTLTDLLSFLLVAILVGSLNARLRVSNTRLRAERDRAQAAVEARDDLMAAVSHELRTPLTAIKTAVYSLKDPQVPLSVDTRDRLLAMIEAEVERLAHFVAGALALRRLENGLTPQCEPTALAEVASAVLDRCAPLLGARPVHFAVADDLPIACVDPTLVDQALSALLENVAVHTPAGTSVAIEAEVRGRDLSLSVSDAGAGIPVPARKRIFDKYERLAQTGPGAGLGLAIARAAVQAQGGRLWVEDSLLGGARFVVLLPDVVPDRQAV